MSRQIQIVALAVAALVLSGGGFVAGVTVGPALGKAEGTSAASSAAPGSAQARRQAGAAAGGAGAFAGAQGQQMTGRVISVNDGSITVEIRQSGGDAARSVIALVGGSTRVVRTVETDIKLGDIKAGDQVLILGQPDQTTGTVSANAVIVGLSALQQVFGGQLGPGAPGGAAPSGSGVPVRRPGASASPSPSARP